MNLSPVIVKQVRHTETPTGHTKVTFALQLEKISKHSESFECFCLV
jgi:hypothetical protein